YLFFVVVIMFFFSSRRRHTRCYRDWSSDVCSSDLEFDLITVYGCQTRRASCPGNLPYASASFDEFPSEAIERAFVAPHCRRREDRGGMRARSRRAARRQVRQTDKSSKCLFASGCRAHLS